MDFPNHFSIVLGLQRDSRANSYNFAAPESIVVKSVGYGRYDISLDYVKKLCLYDCPFRNYGMISCWNIFPKNGLEGLHSDYGLWYTLYISVKIKVTASKFNRAYIRAQFFIKLQFLYSNINHSSDKNKKSQIWHNLIQSFTLIWNDRPVKNCFHKAHCSSYGLSQF